MNIFIVQLVLMTFLFCVAPSSQMQDPYDYCSNVCRLQGKTGELFEKCVADCMERVGRAAPGKAAHGAKPRRG